MPAAQDAPPQKPDAAGSEKTPTKALPLEPTRTISFETSEGAWLSLDVAPDGQTIVFELLGDLRPASRSQDSLRRTIRRSAS